MTTPFPEAPAMHMVYQPIVNLEDGRIVGHEALSRFENGELPDIVYKRAWQQGYGVELEVKAIELAVRDFPHEIDDAYLAVNASAKTIIAMRNGLVKDPGLVVPWPHMLIEISEKDEVHDYLGLTLALRLLRQRKTRIAIDDIGSGISGLAHMQRVIPDVLKIDRVCIQHIDENPIKQSLVAALVIYARDLRSTLVAEGIETEEEKRWCEGLGVDCGQGYLFGRPEVFEEPTLQTNLQ